ncbi:MAG: hypothetical protein U5N26_01805 [Candidatus Marinimicrobia bacterium]|nr:hypothetical protein [Candidatus Neomarinimicrobiota bacterium]
MEPEYFAGTPRYPRIAPKLIHIDSLIDLVGRHTYKYFWYFLIGGLGVFLLLRYKNIPWYIALIAALAFILLPHWMSLLHVGHFSKVRAFMVIPWLVLSFHYLFDKRSWLAVGCFAAAFSWITRTQHFQVVFYGILILLFLFLVPVMRMLFRREWKAFGDLALKVAAGVLLTVAVASQPFISLEEYTPYSTRGGNAVQVEEPGTGSGDGKGVGIDYATRWSLDGKGILSFVIPRFSGGLSREVYTGSKYSRLKGQAVPGYWGEMPFTQSYDFVGIIVFLFAVMGIWTYWKKDGFVRGLTVFSAFALLLALGRHFMPLYRLLFNVVPYFSKFRVPSMIVNMIFISLIILAAYGIRAAIMEAGKKHWKLFAGVFGSGAALLMIILLFSGSFDYARAGEAARYGAQNMEIIRSVRKEFLQNDTLKALLFCLAAGGTLIAYAFEKIRKIPALVLLGLLIGLELFSVTNRAWEYMPLGNPDLLERREFRSSDITRYLEAEPKDARALALGQDSNHYSYFYPTISGYSSIKLQTIQDLREHCLYHGNRINWDIVNMLGGRYIIAPSDLQEPFLHAAARDEQRGEVLYVNERALPKVWFVKTTRAFPDFGSMLRYMNTADFEPDSEVLLLEATAESAQAYGGEGNISLLEYTPNTIRYKVRSETPQFAVFSEMYYPEGWRLRKGDREIPILQSNYALRGAEIPAGEYTLTMDFRPDSYYAGMKVVWIGNVIMILLIGSSLLYGHRKRLFPRRDSGEDQSSAE